MDFRVEYSDRLLDREQALRCPGRDRRIDRDIPAWSR